jgi:hypothetical protein
MRAKDTSRMTVSERKARNERDIRKDLSGAYSPEEIETFIEQKRIGLCYTCFKYFVNRCERGIRTPRGGWLCATCAG